MNNLYEMRSLMIDRLRQLSGKFSLTEADRSFLDECASHLEVLKERNTATVPMGTLRAGSMSWQIVKLLTENGPMTTKEIGAHFPDKHTKDMCSYLANSIKGGRVVRTRIKVTKAERPRNHWGFESVYHLPTQEVTGERFDST